MTRLPASQFPVPIIDTALAFSELLVVTGSSRRLRTQQGTAETVSAIAVGVVKVEGGLHQEALCVTGSAIGGSSIERMAVLVERDGKKYMEGEVTEVKYLEKVPDSEFTQPKEKD